MQPLDKPIDEQPSGLKWQDIEVGTGPLAVDKTAFVHYTGWLEDGTKFDSSLDRGRPFSFPVGAGRVSRSASATAACRPRRSSRRREACRRRATARVSA